MVNCVQEIRKVFVGNSHHGVAGVYVLEGCTSGVFLFCILRHL